MRNSLVHTTESPRFHTGRRQCLRALTGGALFAATQASGQSPPASRTIGLYPTYPPAGALEGLSPEQQAAHLRSLGANLAGGIFEDDETPAALRRAGIRTFGLVVLFQGVKLWEQRPELRPVMANGEPLFQDRWYAGLCPNQPWLRERKLREIEGLLRSGRYDALNLDFIRYPVHWEVPQPKIPDTCYCEVCVSEFRAATGASVPEVTSTRDPQAVRAAAARIRERHLDDWHRWRAGRITDFCREVATLRDRLSPSTQITLAAVPWRPGDYDNAVHRVVGQDFAALADVIDVFNPMSYHVLNARPVEWIGEVNRYFARVTGKPVQPFIIADPDHELSAGQWRRTIEEALSNGASGLIGFPFQKMTATGLLPVFQKTFGAA